MVTETSSNSRSRLALLRRREVKYALILLLPLAAIVWLLAPRRIADVASLEDELRWSRDNSPPRRSIVWRPAEQVRLATPPDIAAERLIRPHLADGGATLYFTLRRDGQTDIYRSRLEGQAWSPGERVAAWNSEHDDIGPAISADGRAAYFYSNRPGGYGGFDLYASHNTGDGWSEPENLGPRINSPAHEYDPAPAPDGRFFFASNRTRRMQTLAESRESSARGAPWSATLRANLDALPFDLYVSERERGVEDWTSPRPLGEINRASSSEGSPFISPSGAFLYFASNRPNRAGEAPNFDLYRARLSGSLAGKIENLGPGINTPQNELEPVLSPEGFRLYFSRNESESDAAAAGETYSLYASTAIEVSDVAAWDASRFSAFVAWLAEHGWWLILGLLIAALVAAILWCMREISLRRVSVPVFFTLAILLHLFLAAGSFFVGLDDELLALVPQEVREIIVAEQMFDEAEEAEPAPEPFQQTADLENLQSPVPADVGRQAPSSTPPSPIETVVRISSAAKLPLDRVVYESPAPQDATAEEPAKPREMTLARAALYLGETHESAELEALPQAPPGNRQMQPPMLEDMAVTRETAAHGLSPLPLAQAAAQDEEPLPREVIAEAKTTVDAPPGRAAESRIARSMLDPTQNYERVAAENIPAAATPRETAPAALVDVVRSAAEPAVGSMPARLMTANDSPSPALAFDAEAIAQQSTGAALPAPAALPVLSPRRGALDVAAAEPSHRIEADSSPLGEVILVDPAQKLRAAVTLSREATTSPLAPRVAKELTLSPGEPTPTESSSMPAELSEMQASPQSGPREIMLARLPSSGVQNDEAVEAVIAGETLAASNAAPEEIGSEKPQVTVNRESGAAPDNAPAGVSHNASLALKTPVSRSEFFVNPSSASAPKTVGVTADLRRSGSPAREEFEAPVELATMGGTEQVRETASEVAAAEVALAREGAATPGAAKLLPVSMLQANGPRRTPDEEAIATERIELALNSNGSAAGLARGAVRDPHFLYAEDNIGLQAMLRLRQSEAKEDLLQAFGGSAETEAAVRRGLTWFEKHQHRDGRWSLERFGELCKEHHPNQPCSGGGRSADTAATGFALLPFLGAGQTHREGDHKECVGRGLTWLVANQKENGDLFTGGGGNTHMYSHGIAAIALCEAYAMTKDPTLSEPAQRAIDFIVKAQHAPSGGWRYEPNQDGDTSVFGWQIMALKSGQMAGLNVPQATLDGAKRWLERVGAQGNNVGQFGYTNAGPSPAMTAEALLCVEYLGAERNDPRLLKGGDYLLTQLPPTDTSYYWYYATQVMFHLQGDHWRQWNQAQRDALVQSQIKDGPAAGTWDPKDRWEAEGGRLYATSLRLLVLEVYYRHLPLYQALE